MKYYNINKYNKYFESFPDRKRYLHHVNVLTKGAALGLIDLVPPKIRNPNPRFSIHDKIGIGTQLIKWRKHGHVIGPIPLDIAIKNNIVINMIFGVPKPNGDTRPILHLSDKPTTNAAVNQFLDSSMCTVEYVQFRELVETIRALGTNAFLWAKDLEDGYYNVPIQIDDIWNLGFFFDGKIYVFKVLPMGLSSSPNIFTEFMFFALWAIKYNDPKLYFLKNTLIGLV